MVEQQLIDYIKNQLSSGHDEESIRKHLVSYGYAVRDVDEAIEIAKGGGKEEGSIPGKEIKETPPEPLKKKGQEEEEEQKVKEGKPKKMPSKKGNLFADMFLDWTISLFKPKEVFKDKGKMKMTYGIKETLTLGAFSGLIISLYNLLLLLTGSYTVGEMTLTSVASLEQIFTTVSPIMELPITFLLSWLAFSGVLYLFTILIGGKGTFSKYSGRISIFMAPVMMIGAILSAVLPASTMVFVFLVLIGLSVYPLITATKMTHNFGMIETLVSFLLPLLILILLLIPLYPNIFSALYGLLFA